MSERSLPIRRTKLYRPAATPDLVWRLRLHELLDGVLYRPAALVSAPAGYGKSVLVSQWLERSGVASAWYSIDESDGDRLVFLSYVTEALETIVPEASAEVSSLLRALEPAPLPLVVDALINALDALEQPLVLVLDDYHRIPAASETHEVVRRILEHPPPNLHLVVVTRRDPPLGLASLRAGGELTEVRQDDLRFTLTEAATLLAAIARREFREEELGDLDRAIEGWPAGLRLAALASRGTDGSERLRRMAKGDPNVQEYLMQEVLSRQPPALRDRLLETSVLDLSRTAAQ
jgi:LuxR family maltose regulon positive regulatory protein